MSSNGQGKLEEIELDKITVDERLQLRQTVKPAVVNRYAELLGDGTNMGPAIVYQEGRKYWLADGFQRHAASRKAEIHTLYCEIRKGTFRDAFLFALGANSDHGQPRDDKTIQQVMRVAFADEEIRGWTDARIARQCNVSPMTVGRWRKKLETSGEITPVISRKAEDDREVAVGGRGRPARTEITPVISAQESEPQWVETDEDREPVLSDEDWDRAEAEEAASSIPSDQKHKAILALCTKAKKLLGELDKEPAGAHLKNQQAAVHLRNFREVVSFSAPWKPCPECSGSDTGCKLCGGCGFIALGQRNVLSDQHKAKLGVA